MHYTVCPTELYTFSIFNNSSIRPDIDPKFFSLEGCEHREWGFALQLAFLTQIKISFAHGTFFSSFEKALQNSLFPMPIFQNQHFLFPMPIFQNLHFLFPMPIFQDQVVFHCSTAI